MRARLRGGIVIDGRNVLDADRYRAEGLFYQGIGRPCAIRDGERGVSTAII